MGATLVIDRAVSQVRGNGGSDTPMRVREAAVFLGVSPQTVYLWVSGAGLSESRFPISA